MPFVLAAFCGLAFGALDQYLGSLITLGPWASSVSGLSAPWLVLPFLAGWTQERTRRAVACALLAVGAALFGYFAMTASPFESVPVSRVVPAFVAVARSNAIWIAGGILTAPVFGLLGRRWRVERWRASAALLAGSVCLEPSARWLIGSVPADGVWLAEIAVGLCLAGAFSLAVHRRRGASG